MRDTGLRVRAQSSSRLTYFSRLVSFFNLKIIREVIDGSLLEGSPTLAANRHAKAWAVGLSV
jgi:hypothetical protein